MGIRSIHPQGKLTWLCTLYWLFPFPALPTHSLTHSNTYLSSYFRSTQTETVVMSPELTFLKTSNFQNYFLMLSISFGFSDTWIWCGSEFWMSAKQYSASKASEKTSPPYLVTEQRQRNDADINSCPWKDYFPVCIYSPWVEERASLIFCALVWVHSKTPGSMVYFWKWKYTFNYLGTVINRIIMKTCAFLDQETGNFNHNTRIHNMIQNTSWYIQELEFMDWVKNEEILHFSSFN